MALHDAFARLRFIGDGTVEFIYASCLLEHFGRYEYMRDLQEWYRTVCSGGLLRLAGPDFAACAKIDYEEGLQDGLTGLVGLVCGGQRDEYDFHKMIFARCVGGIWRQVSHADIDDYSQAYPPHLDKDNGRLMRLNLEAVK